MKNNKLPFWNLIWVMKTVRQSSRARIDAYPYKTYCALAGSKMCMCAWSVFHTFFSSQTLGWNEMTFLETIHQALNSVAFYIIAFEICAQSISQFSYQINSCLENFKLLALPPKNRAPTHLPIKLILPPLDWHRLLYWRSIFQWRSCIVLLAIWFWILGSSSCRSCLVFSVSFVGSYATYVGIW